MKKILLTAMAVVMTLALCACTVALPEETQSAPEEPVEASAADTTAPAAMTAEPASETDTQPTAAASATDAPVPEETSAPQTGDSADAQAALEAVLEEVKSDVQPGTAGSYMTIIRVAADMLDWATETTMTVEEIKTATVAWLSDMGNDEQVEFADKLTSVDSACNDLLGQGAKDLLDSAGCEDTDYPWGEEGASAAAAVMKAVGIR